MKKFAISLTLILGLPMNAYAITACIGMLMRSAIAVTINEDYTITLHAKSVK